MGIESWSSNSSKMLVCAKLLSAPVK